MRLCVLSINESFSSRADLYNSIIFHALSFFFPINLFMIKLTWKDINEGLSRRRRGGRTTVWRGWSEIDIACMAKEKRRGTIWWSTDDMMTHYRTLWAGEQLQRSFSLVWALKGNGIFTIINTTLLSTKYFSDSKHCHKRIYKPHGIAIVKLWQDSII